MASLLITDLGLISWADAYALQQRIAAARKAGSIDDVFLFCEHPHVITLGRNANPSNVLASHHVLRQKNVELQPTNRGGDVTYHGPGQIVGYPIVNLANIKRDVGWYVRTLEEVMIATSAEFRVQAFRVAGKTGIWVRAGDREEKLGAIGVHISRWVTSHGFAYNVSTDLRFFDLIIPCGIADRQATSLEKLLQRNVTPGEVQPHLAKHLAGLLSLEPTGITREALHDRLARIEAASRVEK